MRRNVIVIGGGPAGMMAAGQAACCGARVTLMEKMSSPGRKLLLTGNGRCNFTNNLGIDEFPKFYGENGQFLRNVFARFSNQDLISFFKGRDIGTMSEDNGSVFPLNGRSATILNCLIDFMKEQGVEVKTGHPVTGITFKNNIATGIALEHGTVKCDALILAAGGCSYPGTGSNGDGFRLASAIGHTIVRARPGLVPFTGVGSEIRKLNGLSMADIKVKLYDGDTLLAQNRGSMIFTNFGFSGPVILELSRFMPETDENRKLILCINLAPNMKREMLERSLIEKSNQHGKMKIANILTAFIPARMASFQVERNSIAADMTGSGLDRETRLKILDGLANTVFKIRGTRGFKEAMVTIGGIELSEIDPTSMASRLIKNLFFCGEIIDIAGASGGFNLQAAFSTGYVAGRNAAGGSISPGSS